MSKLSYKTLLIIVAFLLIPIILLVQMNKKAGIVEAGWPPARRASGPETYGPEGLMILGSFYVYALKSKKDGKYYIGQTNNIKKRLEKHNKGQVKSTKHRRPFILLGYKQFKTRSQSMWLEHQLKLHGDQKIKFINNLVNRHHV